MLEPNQAAGAKSKTRKMDSYSLKDESFFHSSVCANLCLLEDKLREGKKKGLSSIYNNFYVPFKHKDDLKGKFYKQVRLVNKQEEVSIISLFQNKRYSEAFYTSLRHEYLSFLPRDVQDYRDEQVTAEDLPGLIPTSAIFAHLRQKPQPPGGAQHPDRPQRPQRHSRNEQADTQAQEEYNARLGKRHLFEFKQESASKQEFDVKLEPDDFPPMPDAFRMSLQTSHTKEVMGPDIGGEQRPEPFEFFEQPDFELRLDCKVEDTADADCDDLTSLFRLDGASSDDQDDTNQL